MILAIDNFDSFVWNLVQYLRELGQEVCVHRNNELTVDEVESARPEAILISPGPGRPEDAGVSVELVRRFSGRIPILGVCLGHQAIAVAVGGRVVNARRVRHGFPSLIHHDGFPLFADLASPFPAMRYHSLVVDEKSLPPTVRPGAYSEDGECMALAVHGHPTYGIQFHPESVLTPDGYRILLRFLEGIGLSDPAHPPTFSPPVADADWPGCVLAAYSLDPRTKESHS